MEWNEAVADWLWWIRDTSDTPFMLERGALQYNEKS